MLRDTLKTTRGHKNTKP